MRRRLPCILAPVLAILLAGGAAAAANGPDEFADLERQIRERASWNLPRLEREVFRREALILASDRTPADIVYRRARALLDDLRAMPSAPDLSVEAAALEALRPEVMAQRAAQQPPAATEQRALFDRLARARRALAFRNPLLDFDAMLFLRHDKQERGDRHMVDQVLGFNSSKTGGVYVLRRPFGPNPAIESLLAHSPVRNGRLAGRTLEDRGGFTGLDLDYDGRSILFAYTEAEWRLPGDATSKDQYCSVTDLAARAHAPHYHFRPDSTYHVFRAGADGSEVRQLTDGPWNETDPVFLPDGRIAFLSERAGGQVRCGMRPLPTSALHAMAGDGGDLVQLSWHDTQEWHPSVNHEGMIVYTRWDYVDRDSDVAHHLWTCFPDGRDPRSPHGNYPAKRESRPWMELSIRAVPGSPCYVAVAAPHHGQAYGSLVLVDPRIPDDGATAQIRRITPEVPFPESESAPGVPHAKGRHAPASEVYGTPWPLSETYHLCVHDLGQRRYEICLVDAFGNRETIHRDATAACLDPIPLRPRPRPPVIPRATRQALADRDGAPAPTSGTVVIANVYDSALAWPAGTRIREIRVVNLFPKDNPWMNEPNIGRAAQSLCRGVLGTAPVEADGSAHFTVPAGAPVYFQALDERGLAVQTMRSDTYLHPGETLSCAGCHEARSGAPVVRRETGPVPLALRRPPSSLTPEAEGANPLTFPRLVQPVLDARCVGCHDRTPRAPSLHGDRFVKYGWSAAFAALSPLGWGMSGGNGVARSEPQRSTPGEVGARTSKLFAMLAAGHHDLRLTPAELRRITVWLDCNCNFYGAYTEPERQARGELVLPRWGLPAWMPQPAPVPPSPVTAAVLR